MGNFSYDAEKANIYELVAVSRAIATFRFKS
jgi:hypothetical protein